MFSAHYVNLMRYFLVLCWDMETRGEMAFFLNLVLACTIDLMNELGLDREIIFWRF